MLNKSFLLVQKTIKQTQNKSQAYLLIDKPKQQENQTFKEIAQYEEVLKNL